MNNTNLPTTGNEFLQTVGDSFLPVSADVGFSDIDWGYFFNDVMRFSYTPPLDFDSLLNEDGGFDFEKIKTELKYSDAKRYLKKSGKPNVEKIVARLRDESGTSISYEYMVFAVPDPAALDAADRAALEEAIISRCNFLLENGSIKELFECMETLAARFLEGFQILGRMLPACVRRENVFRMPSYAKSEDERRAQLIENGFAGDELEEMLQQSARHTELIFYFQALHRQKSFRLKDGRVVKVEQTKTAETPDERILNESQENTPDKSSRKRSSRKKQAFAAARGDGLFSVAAQRRFVEDLAARGIEGWLTRGGVDVWFDSDEEFELVAAAAEKYGAAVPVVE